MFGRRTAFRHATTLVLLAAIAVSGMAPAAPAAVSCLPSVRLASPAPCAAAAACCCAAQAEPQACMCRPAENVPTAPPATASDEGRASKCVACLTELLFAPTVAATDAGQRLIGRQTRAAAGRSVQTLLCIWRI